ncbi:F-box only protein 36-like [Clarias gariepinus]|uniref:F-box only protein 36-like n=1 Tax=Clarias gariepinus TaxID=13013 RepID=UPI00234D5BC3|nr:F-box only protein 36-like [Clarias gariepinus]
MSDEEDNPPPLDTNAEEDDEEEVGDGGFTAELLGDPLFEISGQGPAPIKDHFCLQITPKEVIWRWWKISLRVDNTKPGEQREKHKDYLDDSRLHGQVMVVFGPDVLEYTKCLCGRQYDYLPRLPDPLLLRIMSYLDLEDVAQIALTCQKLKQLCTSEQFWEQIVRLHCDNVTTGMEDLAREVGWRCVFFTNKLLDQKKKTQLVVSDPTALDDLDDDDV